MQFSWLRAKRLLFPRLKIQYWYRARVSGGPGIGRQKLAVNREHAWNFYRIGPIWVRVRGGMFRNICGRRVRVV